MNEALDSDQINLVAAEEMERDRPLARLLPHVLQARGSDLLKRDYPALYTRVRHQLPHHQHSLPPPALPGTPMAGSLLEASATSDLS